MNFNYQNLITGPLGVLHFIINDVGGAYREDLLTFGLTLIKYYILFKFLSFAAKTLFQKIYDGLRAKKWARVAKKKKNVMADLHYNKNHDIFGGGYEASGT